MAKGKRVKAKAWYTAIGIAMTVILIAWISYWLSPFTGGNDNGVFGDSFGALNTLFSGLAFGCLVITILMQRQELEYQREELEETRRVLDEQKTELNRQANLAQQESLERPFFVLVNGITESLNLVTMRVADKDYVSGPAALATMSKELLRMFGNKKKEGPPTFDTLKAIYENKKETLDAGPSIVLQNVITAMEYLDEHDLDKDAVPYAGIVKAQIPKYGRVPLLFALVGMGSESESSKLLARHGFFDDLEQSSHEFESEICATWRQCFR